MRSQKLWEETHCLERRNQINEKHFTMLFPPPNVTGKLHIGHALTISIQDTIMRYRLMKGERIRWIPGFDHAGIATQSVVEKHLLRTRGLTRKDLSRKEFVEEIYRWTDEYKAYITKQMKRTGAVFDWESEIFTMDEKHSEIVRKAFVKLFNEGLIYRDTRIVNWCAHLGTTVSDIEVEYEDVEKKKYVALPGREKAVPFGELYTFKYPLATETGQPTNEFIPVATTRPETILGDVAVAVHPNDERFTKFHGKRLYHPLLGTTIPLILDSTLVDLSFGTGAVKITPAHDNADYDCAKRHGLRVENLFDFHGKVRGDFSCQEYSGIDKFMLRRIVKEKLELTGHLISVESTKTRIARCSRSGDVIEPMVMPQWFVKCDEMAKDLLKHTEERDIRVYPPHFENMWKSWLTSTKDWCISRQLWWGHRIPAYQISYKHDEGSGKEWIVANTEKEATAQLEAKVPGCSIELIEQDQDVLDTWFSSSLLPLTAAEVDTNTFKPSLAYPASGIESGFDIIFFWIARMAMLSKRLSGQLPFSDIYLHPMVRDSDGRKMSKSLGNVLDPMMVINGATLDQMSQELLSGNLSQAEHKRATQLMKKNFPKGIAESGWDALRFALLDATQNVRSINLDIQRVYTSRHFGNKLWNVTRFLGTNVDKWNYEYTPGTLPLSLSDEQNFVLSKLDECTAECEASVNSWKLSDGTTALTRFFINNLCDKFLEVSKIPLNSDENSAKDALDVFHFVFDRSLRVLFPFMPHLAEDLWQHIRAYSPSLAESVMLTEFPLSSELKHIYNKAKAEQMEYVFDVIHHCRSFKNKEKLSRTAQLIVNCPEDKISLLQKHRHSIELLTRSRVVLRGSEFPVMNVVQE